MVLSVFSAAFSVLVSAVAVALCVACLVAKVSAVLFFVESLCERMVLFCGTFICGLAGDGCNAVSLNMSGINSQGQSMRK